MQRTEFLSFRGNRKKMENNKRGAFKGRVLTFKKSNVNQKLHYEISNDSTRTQVCKSLNSLRYLSTGLLCVK